MQPIKVHKNIEGVAADVPTEKLKFGEVTDIGALPRGVTGGRTSVSVLVRLDDGTVVVGQTSLRLFQQAAAALTGHYGSE